MVAMTTRDLALKSATDATRTESNYVAAWARRRPWTRTDTGRWLNDRSEALLAWARRRLRQTPSYSRQIGYWLKENEPATFSRAHARLAACANDDDRSGLLIDEVMR